MVKLKSAQAPQRFLVFWSWMKVRPERFGFEVAKKGLEKSHYMAQLILISRLSENNLFRLTAGMD